MPRFEVNFSGVAPPVQRVIANHLLNSRRPRGPDYRAQVHATTGVIKALAETPEVVLEKLSHAVQQLTAADSAGVSLLGRDSGHRIFLWQSTVGLFDTYRGSVVQYEESPCGAVLDTDQTLLMVKPGTAFQTAAKIHPRIQEVLLVPFHVDGRAVGTVWVISQSSKTFDAEDARLVSDMSELAALAYHVLTKLGDLELLIKTVQLVADERFNCSSM